MRTVLVKSAPALAVLLVLAVGFTLLNGFSGLDASPSENEDYCDELWQICAQEAQYASNTCAAYPGSARCREASEDADSVCDAAADYCRDN